MFRNEIGSEFYNVPVSCNETGFFNKKTEWFISGTAALRYIIADIIKKRHIRKASLPSWCCECMIEPFLSAELEVEFYPVVFDGNSFKINTSGVSGDVLLIMDYFGYAGYAEVPSGYDGTVIRDVTHSLFSAEYSDAHYYFGSLRKWAGFWTGGFAWSDLFTYDNIIPPADERYVSMRREAMEHKTEYLNGLHSSKEYLKQFEKCEDFLDNCEVMRGAERDIGLAARLDVDFLIGQRKQNAKVLLSELKHEAIFPELKENECPMFVPIYVKNGKRDALRKFLINNEVYCPVHWPASDIHKLTEETKYIYDNELSIVCDQRYGINEMRRILKLIKSFMQQ